MSRTVEFRLRCDSCPNSIKVEITDQTFVTKAGDWAVLIAERVGWTLKDGAVRCVVRGGQT